jgi:hypothetical protein
MHEAQFFLLFSLFDWQCTCQNEQKQSEINFRDLFNSHPPSFVNRYQISVVEKFNPKLERLVKRISLKHVSRLFCRIIIKRYLSKHEETSLHTVSPQSHIKATPS